MLGRAAADQIEAEQPAGLGADGTNHQEIAGGHREAGKDLIGRGIGRRISEGAGNAVAARRGRPEGRDATITGGAYHQAAAIVGDDIEIAVAVGGGIAVIGGGEALLAGRVRRSARSSATG